MVGGASGLGEATSRRLHGGGAKVTIADVNAEKGDVLAAELGDSAQFVEADVTNADQVQAAVDAAHELAGNLRISMHCAGVGWAERTASSRGPHQLQPFEIVIGVNLIGTFNALRFAAYAMLDNDPDDDGERGVMVHTASISAFDGQVTMVPYAAAKGAVVSMVLPMARDLAPIGVRVCAIAPGAILTPRLSSPTAQAALLPVEVAASTSPPLREQTHDLRAR